MNRSTLIRRPTLAGLLLGVTLVAAGCSPSPSPTPSASPTAPVELDRTSLTGDERLDERLRPFLTADEGFTLTVTVDPVDPPLPGRLVTYEASTDGKALVGHLFVGDCDKPLPPEMLSPTGVPIIRCVPEGGLLLER